MAHLLDATEVAYRYPQNNRGLTPVSLQLEPGERVLIAGPSGGGKSTLARCLAGLIPHLYRGTLEGCVWLDGLRTTEVPLWQLAEHVGMVFQNPAGQMLALSVEEEIIFGLENLGLCAQVISDRLEEILARFGLEALRSRQPQTLSGGEQQKLALAAMIARQPPLLVLDEPLSMLDTTAAAELVAYLTQLAGVGVGLVICEHRAEMLEPIPQLRTLTLAPPNQGDLDGSAPHLKPLAHGPLGTADAPEGRPFGLDVSHLTVRLGGRAVLRDLSFTAPAGQVLAVVGRNGVGKTTLMRALAGLQKHEGEVVVHGGPPRFGLVFQNADLQLFNGSVREEILYRVPAPDMALYAWLLEALGLENYEAVPPLLLSEGEKRRVALASVLIRRPAHGLLLDEPAVGQDTGHKAMLIHLARGLADAGQLVIVTTHDLALVAQADRLLLLGPDGFVADGPPSMVLRDQAAWDQVGLLVPSWLEIPESGRGEGR